MLLSLYTFLSETLNILPGDLEINWEVILLTGQLQLLISLGLINGFTFNEPLGFNSDFSYPWVKIYIEVSGLLRFYIHLAEIYDKEMTFSMQILALV